VFVDQENCCDCTGKRQAATWKNLQDALGGVAKPPPVEVVHLDSQADQARVYLDLKPVMVPPGLYFFDEEGVLAEMLQGEVTREQLEKALQ